MNHRFQLPTHCRQFTQTGFRPYWHRHHRLSPGAVVCVTSPNAENTPFGAKVLTV